MRGGLDTLLLVTSHEPTLYTSIESHQQNMEAASALHRTTFGAGQWLPRSLHFVYPHYLGLGEDAAACVCLGAAEAVLGFCAAPVPAACAVFAVGLAPTACVAAAFSVWAGVEVDVVPWAGCALVCAAGFAGFAAAVAAVGAVVVAVGVVAVAAGVAVVAAGAVVVAADPAAGCAAAAASSFAFANFSRTLNLTEFVSPETGSLGLLGAANNLLWDWITAGAAVEAT